MQLGSSQPEPSLYAATAPANPDLANEVAALMSPQSETHLFDRFRPDMFHSAPDLGLFTQETPQCPTLPGAAVNYFQGDNTQMPWPHLRLAAYETDPAYTNPAETGQYSCNTEFDTNPASYLNQGDRKIHAATWSPNTPNKPKKKTLEAFKAKLDRFFTRTHTLLR
jgi:hypothetical protein